MLRAAVSRLGRRRFPVRRGKTPVKCAALELGAHEQTILLTAPNVSAADRRITLFALAVVVLLSALDQTVVATAMPRIIEQLQGLSMYAWVTTAYMLASTVSVPIYGKLSDQYGRRSILLLGVGLFLVGSAACGMAGEFGDLPLLGGGMTQLVAFRAVQGLGAGALMTMSFAVMADMYSPRERGRLFGVFGGVFGLAGVLGPFVGGFFTDHGGFALFGREIEGWRWIFYVNLPLGLGALFMILRRMPALQPARAEAVRIDFAGAALVVLTAAPLLLALTLGGVHYAWDSGPMIGLLAATLLGLVLLAAVESRAPQPMIPLHLFRIPAFRRTALATFVMGMAFLGLVLFMPLYMQVVQGVSATYSGLALLPLMGGMIVTVVLCGRLVTRTGRYKAYIIGGGVLLLAGVVALINIGPDTTPGDLAWRLLLTGVGLGPAQTLFSLVMQNAAPQADVGAATGMSQFSRQMGSAAGVALFGAFLTHGLLADLPRYIPLAPGASEQRIDLADVQTQAMDVNEIRKRVERAMEARYDAIERAHAGDRAAEQDILSDPRLPGSIKEALRDGGVRSRVQSELQLRADVVERELGAGEQGRERLMRASDLPAALKEQLARIPRRAFEDPHALQKVSQLFRAALLAQEDALVAVRTQEALQTARAELSVYAEQLVQETHRGLKAAFAGAVVHMLQRALWVVIAAVAIMLFIPELPLRARPAA